MIDRLAAYEDTGLTPKEVSEYQHLCDSYVEAGLDSKFVQFCINATQNGLSMNHICELAQTEKDGRLVEYIPGDKVYEISGTPWIVESSEIHLIGGEIKHLFRCGHPGTEDYCAMYEDEILTREEAEAALKKREDLK